VCENKNVQIILFIYLFMQAVHLRFGFSFVLQAVLNRIYIWTYPFWAGSGLAIGLLPFVCLLDAQILLRRLGLRVLRPVSFVLFVVFVVFGFVCSSIRGPEWWVY